MIAAAGDNWLGFSLALSSCAEEEEKMTVVDVAILLRCAKFRVNRVHRLAAPARAGAASPRIQWPSGDVVSMVDSLSFFMTSASSTMEIITLR